MIATSGSFSQLYSAPNSFSAVAAPRTPLGELTALYPDPLAGLRGTYFQGGRERGKREKGKGKKRGGEGKGR